jgi:hypothetical protein
VYKYWNPSDWHWVCIKAQRKQYPSIRV